MDVPAGQLFELSPKQQEFQDFTEVVWEDGEEAYAQPLARQDGTLRGTADEREPRVHQHPTQYSAGLLKQMEDNMGQKLGQLGGPDDDEAYERIEKRHDELQEWVIASRYFFKTQKFLYQLVRLHIP